ncbi:SurA N-terminal domain-containing protein [Herbaspirillum rhizosphaerae]|uniref:SurA N-terminal domain-containing protein n=1 Tax=Herbaspirillum rhizosphaerae TaxID=346179 RepID=UPI00067C974F|nr:SurA N-terminal domain-containing protein [Herbaspirillum rhizosphaerae]
MFEFIRNHQRLMQFLLLLLIVPSFAFFGVQGYSGFGDGDNAVAKVAGQTITKEEWDAAQRQQLERLRQMAGGQIDTKVFDTPEARRDVLESLIAQRALAAEVANDKLTVTDQALQQNIMQIPGLIKPDGKFDNEQYNMLLAAQGLTPKSYEASQRRALALQQLNFAVQGTAFAPKSVSARLSDLNDQERSVQELSFKAASYIGQVKVTDEMVKAYYDKNGSKFEVPEQARIEYVVLDSAAVAAQVSVSDADIKSYYDQNIKQYSTDEQRRASHILLEVKKGASAADKAAIKAKADELVAQLRKNPGDFAKLAKANSQDPGSKDQGGDLGFFGKGAMLKSFEDAAYKLKQGEISDPVESDFGYHIIQLTGIKAGSVKPLDEVKGEIAGDIKKQLAAKKYAELADIFNNTVYEQGDSLKPVADKLKLKIETVAGVTRLPNPALAPNTPYNNPKFLKALFTDDTIKGKHNTEAVQIAPTTLMAGHIVEYKPVTKRPFDEVKSMVRELVTQDEAMALAKKAGEAKLAELKAKDDAAGFGDVKVASRVKTQGWNQDAFLAVMKADTAKLPAYTGVELPGQGYSVFRVTKVAQPATPDAARRKTEQEQIANVLAEQEMLSYINFVKEKVKTKILKGGEAITSGASTGKPADAAR